jgi:uncharacterized protein
LDIKFLTRISDLASEQWNALLENDYPFLNWHFLHALEQSAAVSEQSGWQVHHVLVYEQQQLIALMPMYLKFHSQGEYVFDHSWAQAYQRHGLRYYPKWLCAIPFTPCQGPRLCVAAGLREDINKKQEIFAAIFAALIEISTAKGISSWHCLFPEQNDLPLFSHEQIVIREAVQFQWFNKSYQSFEDYLTTFTSKRRKNLKRERRLVSEQGIQIRQLCGSEISESYWQQFFIFYQATYWKHGMREYLNLDFFKSIAKNMPGQLLMVVAEKDNKIIAAALSFIGADTLYGRYWGCLEEYDNLHFELCYYQGLEFCISRQLRCFNSGAQGEHKISRGFEPVKTWSLHWIAHPGFREAINEFVNDEKRHLAHYREDAAGLLPFKPLVGKT